jgi:hypothetical protein
MANDEIHENSHRNDLPKLLNDSTDNNYSKWVTKSVTHGLCVLCEQLFMRLLFTICRASEFTLDLESCLNALRQS